MRTTIIGAAVLTALSGAGALAQSYDDLARQPSAYVGTIVKFKGKVVQASESENKYLLRVNVTKKPYDIWSDTVLVQFRASPSGGRLLEGDIINFRGRSAGITSYTAVLGQTIQLPSVAACEISDAASPFMTVPGPCDTEAEIKIPQVSRLNTPVRSIVAPVRPIAVFVNKSRTVSTKPFYKASLASTAIADITPLNDHSLYITGKQIGTTNISIFDKDMQLIEAVDLEVTKSSQSSNASSVPPTVVAINKSRIVSFTQPFKAASVAAPEIVDATPITDRSLYIVGKTVGTTDISVFDKDMQLIEAVDLEVTKSSQSSNASSKPPTVVAINKSRIVSFTQPFKRAAIAAPEIAEITPTADRSLNIVGKTVGTTNISVFDKDMQLIEAVDLEVTGD